VLRAGGAAQRGRPGLHRGLPAPGGGHAELQDPRALQRLRRGVGEGRRAGEPRGGGRLLRAARRAWPGGAARRGAGRREPAARHRVRPVRGGLAAPPGRAVIRRIEPGDAPLLQELRLGALRLDPLAFASTYEREVSWGSEWDEWAEEDASGD